MTPVLFKSCEAFRFLLMDIKDWVPSQLSQLCQDTQYAIRGYLALMTTRHFVSALV